MDDLTLVIPTSHIDIHPNTIMIEKAIKSIYEYAGCPGRTIIVCDGLHQYREDKRDDYNEYKRRLRMLGLGEVHELPENVGLGGNIHYGVNQVKTPLMFIFQHDWRVRYKLPTQDILDTLRRDDHPAQYIRLNGRRIKLNRGNHQLQTETEFHAPIPLVITDGWNDHPHFCLLEHYQEHILPHIWPPVKPKDIRHGRDGVDTIIYRRYRADVHQLGLLDARMKWGVYIYGKIGDSKHAWHLDGRETGR